MSYATIDRAVSTLAVVESDIDVQARTEVANTSPTAATIAAKSLLEMEDRRKQWESTVYRTSNQALYALLAECYVYGGDLPFDQAKQRSKELNAFLQSRGYQVKNESPLMTRIVKAVFGNVDRRRISTYSLVLRRAKAENVLATRLANWIEECGGVQEIKLARSSSYVAPKQKAARAMEQLESTGNLATVKSEALSLLADADKLGETCVLIAEQLADGTFAIKALTRSGGAVNAALVAVYGEQSKATA